MLWMLLLLFLSQALLLPFISQLKPAQDSTGKWVMLCTMRGMQQVNVASNESAKQNTTTHSCPACSLSNTIDNSGVATPVFFHVARQEHDEIIPLINLVTTHQFTPAFHIRAPPSA